MESHKPNCGYRRPGFEIQVDRNSSFLLVRLILIMIFPFPRQWQVVLFLLFPGPLLAFQGLYLPAYGARQAGMGGAFSSMGGSVMDLENNPAGLGILDSPVFEVGGSLTKAQVQYNDTGYNTSDGSVLSNSNRFSPFQPMPYTGFAIPISANFSAGMALYLQGGGGGELDGILRRSAGDTNDVLEDGDLVSESYSFRFALARLTGGFSYRHKNLIAGFALDYSAARNTLEKKIKYVLSSNGTYDPSLAGASLGNTTGGFSYRSKTATALSGKIGMTWIPEEWLRLSLSYSSETVLPMNGTVRVDTIDPARMGSIPIKRKMRWPDRFTGGLTLDLDPITISVDLRYVRWSRAFDRQSFVADRPTFATPAGITLPFLIMNLHWKDQPVYATGMEYRLGRWQFRAGFSHAPSPVVSTGLNPFLGSTTENHYSLGIGMDTAIGSFDLALEYAPPVTQKGSPYSDWSLSRMAGGEIIEYSRTSSTRTVYLGYRTYFSNEQELNPSNHFDMNDSDTRRNDE